MKTDNDTKVKEIEKKITDHKHDEYITTPEFNKLTAENFAARLAQADLVTKTDFDNKLSSLNRKITANKTKHLVVQNELKKLKTFDLSYFRGNSHFEEDGTQNWYVFQRMSMYLKVACANDINYILSWESKELTNIGIDSIKTTNCMFNPYMNTYYNGKIRIKFDGGF